MFTVAMLKEAAKRLREADVSQTSGVYYFPVETVAAIDRVIMQENWPLPHVAGSGSVLDAVRSGWKMPAGRKVR